MDGRSLVGYSPWGCKESDMTERLHFHFHFSLLRRGAVTDGMKKRLCVQKQEADRRQ